MKQKLSFVFLGRLSMSLMLVTTGAAHFFKTEVMIQSMPDVIPFKKEIVLITGIIEFIFAFGLLSRKWFRLTSILLIVFLLCILPANIVGSLKRVELGGMENGPPYLWFRIPLQFIFIVWVYYFGIYRGEASDVVAGEHGPGGFTTKQE